MDSDSSYYETTYSEDERIEQGLHKLRTARQGRINKKNQARIAQFTEFLKEDLPIFTLPGLTFHTFRHLKIKFSFQPSIITNFVIPNVIFYVSLKFVNGHWRVKRDTIPVGCKWTIYKVFYDQAYFAVDDENIFAALTKIYEILVNWAREQEQFRLEKFERYKKDNEVELDSDDEQLFLTEDERVARYQRKVKILRRMIPPNKRRKMSQTFTL